MFQMMRFSVEEINNSSTLLPNVSLGYEIFNRCSDTQNFPSVLALIAQNGSIPAPRYFNHYQPKIIAVTGPHESTRSITVSQFFMMDLIPMVNYGASNYDLSNKKLYPSFLRTVPNNKVLVEIIIRIIKWFGWNWVAFIGSHDDYSRDGLKLFTQELRDYNICLAYQEILEQDSNYQSTLQTLEKLNVKVIVVFSSVDVAKNIIKAAIKNNIRNKVWIAGEGWSMNKQIPNEPGIQNIGNVFGITEKKMSFPGFNQFIYSSRTNGDGKHSMKGKNQPPQTQKRMCNQVCNNCTYIDSENIINENPTFSFPIYAAIYTMAHALHNVLQCDENGCNRNMSVYPFMLLKEMKKLNFTLNGRQVMYDNKGDTLVAYDVVYWSLGTGSSVKRIGSYTTYPKISFSINNSLIGWDRNASVPFGNCSAQCQKGFQRQRDNNHACCFQCKICQRNTYVNYTQNPYACVACNADEWSEQGSTSCKKRSILYLHYTNPLSLVILAFSVLFIVLCIAITILFLYSINTPVVKSAGGNMCFIMLASLAMSSISVFFFFEQPTMISCIFRNVMFYVFYTISISCLAVRSFQIVCIFKMAAKFPKIYRLWVQHNGQWLVIAMFPFFQLMILVLWVILKTPDSSTNTEFYYDAIILGCSTGHFGFKCVSVFFTWSLSVLCFSFSYMGTDLPKNYNEAKSITFSMLLFYISWSFYFTANMISADPHVQLLNAVAQLFSLYGILMSYFIPKSYVIVFQPKKNTQAYFQTSIQTYTQTMSRM
ncbi:taste receptor type 1 member 1-like [Trichomycterus rosablanca]|uniref:taste receptor type 1 member 1-like n=1 Tax=Trichomycterus rosablanca TaxID=2290929 RepID=UPI002F351FFB